MKYLLKNYVFHLSLNLGILIYLIIYTLNDGAGGAVGIVIISASLLVLIVGSKIRYIEYAEDIHNQNQKDKIKWTKQ